MRWHFGGNFEPVIITCKFDWIKCPFALIYYIWYEVVTDVVDCFTNEIILWAVSTILLICIAFIYLFYWKMRWMKELILNKETLTQVDSKVSELELKLNILTYKAQYGIWPPLYFTNKNIKNNLRSVEPEISRLNDENAWIECLLMRKKFNKRNFLYNIQTQLSISNLNTIDVGAKYIVSSFEDEKLSSINEKASQTSLKREQNKETLCNGPIENKSTITNLSEDSAYDNLNLFKNSLVEDHYAENSFLGTKRNVQGNVDAEMFQSELGFSDISSIKRQAIADTNFTNEEVKLFQASENKILNANIVPSKCEENFLCFSRTDIETEKDTYETLNQVKENLKNIHMTIQNYCSKNSWKDTSIIDKESIKIVNNYKEDDLYQRKANSSTSYDSLDNPCNEYYYVATTDLQSTTSTHDKSATNTYPIYNTGITNEQIPFKPIRHKIIERLTFEDTEINQQEKIENQQQTQSSNICAVTNQPNDCKDELEERFLEYNIHTENCLPELDNYERDIKYLSTNFKLITNNTNFLKSNLAETFKESDSDDRSTAALLQEALKIKKEIFCRFDLKKDKGEINIDETGKQGETKDFLEWKNPVPYLQPMILDMITEESGVSCYTDKKIKTKKKKKKLKNSQKKEVHRKERNILQNNESSHMLIQDRIEDEISDYKTIMKQKSIHLLNDESNKQFGIFDNNSNDVPKFSKSEYLILPTDNANLKENDKHADSKMHILNANQKFTFNNSNTDLNEIYSTDLLSDINVDKLIDQLIETEKKCTSAKNLSKTKSKQNFEMDNLNKLIDFNNFLESAQSQNEECDNFLTEFNIGKLNHSVGEKIMDDHFQMHIENDNLSDLEIKDLKTYNPKDFNTVINAYNTNCDVKKITKKEDGHNKFLLDDKQLHTQCNSIKNDILSSNLRLQNAETINEQNRSYNEVEGSHGEHLNNFWFEYNSKISSNKSQNEHTVNDFESKNKDVDVSESNFFKSENCAYIDPIYKSINVDTNAESEKTMDKRDAGDFYNDNESHAQHHQIRKEIFNTKESEIVSGIIKNNLPGGDTNPSVIESSCILISPKKSKSMPHHESYRIPSGNQISSMLRNSEQNFLKTHKNSISKMKQKSVKNNFDLGSNRQLKAESSLNLTSVEKTNSSSTHVRSKSYVIPRDISLSIQNNSHKKKLSMNPLSDVGSKSFYQVVISTSPKEVLPDATKFQIKDNASFKDSTICSRSFSNFDILTPINMSTENQNNEVNIKDAVESTIFSTESPLKLCMLTSNNKLEDITEAETDSDKINSVKEPIIVLFDDYKEKKDTELKSQINDDNLNNLVKKKETVEMQKSNDSNQSAIIYINYISADGQITTKVLSSEQFLEYIKDRELKIKNVTSQEYYDLGIFNNEQLMTLSKSQGTAVIPLVTKNDITDSNYLHPSVHKMTNVTTKPWSLKIENKETEVLVKPPTMDVSTSVSDLPNISDVFNNKINEFRMFNVL